MNSMAFTELQSRRTGGPDDLTLAAKALGRLWYRERLEVNFPLGVHEVRIFWRENLVAPPKV